MTTVMVVSMVMRTMMSVMLVVIPIIYREYSVSVTYL